MVLTNTVIFIVYLAFSLGLELVYLNFAKKSSLVDQPNERSSHSSITLRGGGIIFPLVLLAWYVLNGFPSGYFILGLVLISIVSFLDDKLTLSAKPRLLVHLIAASLLLFETGVFTSPIWIVPVAYILIIGWINAFNFMDGINGISSVYALFVLASVYVLQESLGELMPLQMLIAISAAVIAFSIFNFRKRAVVFMGDVGSVSLAFILAFVLVNSIVSTGYWELILFLSVYGIDSAFTILQRLINGEDIFKPHRSHLYQILANEVGVDHRMVSLGYGFVQLAFNYILILILKDAYSTWEIVLLFLSLSLIYIGIKLPLLKQYNLSFYSNGSRA